MLEQEFARLDADGNGVLVKAEFPGRVPACRPETDLSTVPPIPDESLILPHMEATHPGPRMRCLQFCRPAGPRHDAK